MWPLPASNLPGKISGASCFTEGGRHRGSLQLDLCVFFVKHGILWETRSSAGASKERTRSALAPLTLLLKGCVGNTARASDEKGYQNEDPRPLTEQVTASGLVTTASQAQQRPTCVTTRLI